MTADIPETRASLLVRLKDSADQQAWHEFVEIYQPLILRIALQRGLQPADARDLAQEVLTKVASRIGDWDHNPDRGTLRGWLSTVTRNLVTDFFRTQRRQPKSLGDPALARHSQELAANDDWYLYEERSRIFRWAADRARSGVAPSTWSAFWMTAVEDESPQDVARTLQMSVGAVYIARSRMLARIRELASGAIEQSSEWEKRNHGDQP